MSIRTRLENRKKDDGLTLIELVIVIAIIGILMAIGIGGYQLITGNAIVGSAVANNKSVTQSVKVIIENNGGESAGDGIWNVVEAVRRSDEFKALITPQPVAKGTKMVTSVQVNVAGDNTIEICVSTVVLTHGDVIRESGCEENSFGGNRGFLWVDGAKPGQNNEDH